MSIIFVDFKKNKVAKTGFVVDKNNDRNVIYQHYLQSDRELLEKKLFELPPGPDCPTDDDINVLTSPEKRSALSTGDELMTRILTHADNCQRCDALLRYRVLQYKWGL